jgi:hypothetical protein
MAQNTKRVYTSADWAYAIGTVLLVLLVGWSATQVTNYSPGLYTPSQCTSNGSGGCSSYIPSSYAPASVTTYTGGVVVAAILLAVVAYYWGKREGRATISTPPASSPTGPDRLRVPPAAASPGFCQYCGTPTATDARFCRTCGRPTQS